MKEPTFLNAPVPPQLGGSPFITNEELPSDYSLCLKGKANQMLKKEIPLDSEKSDYPMN